MAGTIKGLPHVLGTRYQTKLLNWTFKTIYCIVGVYSDGHHNHMV